MSACDEVALGGVSASGSWAPWGKRSEGDWAGFQAKARPTRRATWGREHGERRGADAIGEWRGKHPGVPLDLRWANLRAAGTCEAGRAEADLRGADPTRRQLAISGTGRRGRGTNLGRFPHCLSLTRRHVKVVTMNAEQSSKPPTSGQLAAYPPQLAAELEAIAAASEGARVFVAYLRELCNAAVGNDRRTAESVVKLLFRDGGYAAPGIIPGWTEAFRQVRHLIEAVSQPVRLGLPDCCQTWYGSSDPGGHTRPEWFTDEVESRLHVLEKVFHRDSLSSPHEAAESLLGHLVSVARAAGLSPDDLHVSASRWELLKLYLTPICGVNLSSLSDTLTTVGTAAAIHARDNFKFVESGQRGKADLVSGEPAVGVKQETPPATSRKTSRGKKPDAELAIRRYIADHHDYYDSLKQGCQQHDPITRRQAEKMFGRNALVKHLGLTAGTVSGTDVWQKQIKPDLFPERPGDALSKLRHSGGKVGFEIAVEWAGGARGDQTSDAVVRNETVAMIRAATLPQDAKDQIESQLQTGAITDDEARYCLECYRDSEKSRKADRQPERRISLNRRRNDKSDR